ncbi:MAG: methyltransferase [Actinomycetaceae bacterium]|nr:methyltransferase [Actinomycetaceae bacterium]
MNTTVAPPAVSADLAARLRADFLAARWTNDHIAALLGDVIAGAMARGHFGPARVRCAEAIDRRESTRACAALTALFMLGGSVTSEDVQAALPSVTIEELTQANLLSPVPSPSEIPNRRWCSPIDLRPHEIISEGEGASAPADTIWWIASDIGEERLPPGVPLPREHVMGLGQATLSLLRSMVTTPCETALDLGTGCGIVAMHMTRFASHVTASDLSARALGFARFNATLAGLGADCLRFVQGSFFEPVADQCFDRIVSNPPFVITPQELRDQGVWQYRDAGLPGDSLIPALLTEAAGHLNPGGLLTMLANWEVHAPDADPHGLERVETWLNKAGLDAWVVAREVLDTAQYAEMWLRDGGLEAQSNTEDSLFERGLNSYLSDFEARGVSGVALGIINARLSETPSSKTRVFLQANLGPEGAPTGTRALEVYLALDWLAAHPSEEERLDARLHLADSVLEEHTQRPGTGDLLAIRLHSPTLGWSASDLSPEIVGLLGALDGDLSVSQAATGVAVLTDQDPMTVRTHIASRLPDLLLQGVLSV